MAGGVRIALSRDVLLAAQHFVRNDADDASAVTIAAARWQPGAPIRVTLRGSAERSVAHDDRGGASATACAAAYSDVGGPPTQSLDADRKAAADFVETAARCASESEATAAGVASTLRDLEGALQGLEALVGDARALLRGDHREFHLERLGALRGLRGRRAPAGAKVASPTRFRMCAERSRHPTYRAWPPAQKRHVSSAKRALRWRAGVWEAGRRVPPRRAL